MNFSAMADGYEVKNKILLSKSHTNNLKVV